MPANRWSACFLMIVAMLVAAPSWAESPTPDDAGAETTTAPAADASAADVAPDRIEELVRQMDDASFRKRQEATRELETIGPAAIPHLEEAAQGNSREVTTRSIDLIKKMMDGGNDQAEAAMKRLADCDQPSAAQRAKNALAKDEPAGGMNPFGFPGARIVGNARIQLRVAGRAGAKRIAVKNVNGTKQIEVEEGDKKVVIHEEAGGKITMKITEKDKNGKEETKKYEAKDADELKKNHPEAHKVYEKYAKQGAGGAIQIQGIQIGPGGARRIQIQPRPGNKPPARPLPAVPQRRGFDKKQQAKQLEQAIENLKRLQDRMEDDADRAEQLQKSIDRLREMADRLSNEEKGDDGKDKPQPSGKPAPDREPDGAADAENASGARAEDDAGAQQ